MSISCDDKTKVEENKNVRYNKLSVLTKTKYNNVILLFENELGKEKGQDLLMKFNEVMDYNPDKRYYDKTLAEYMRMYRNRKKMENPESTPKRRERRTVDKNNKDNIENMKDQKNTQSDGCDKLAKKDNVKNGKGKIV